jgi:hypothetical protein
MEARGLYKRYRRHAERPCELPAVWWRCRLDRLYMRRAERLPRARRLG